MFYLQNHLQALMKSYFCLSHEVFIQI